jgi:FkbM family methyltransferase
MRKQIEEFATKVQWRLTKPEYLFRPSTILKRFGKPQSSRTPSHAMVQLYWGLSLRVSTRDIVSSGILRTGIDDITQSEIIWRLLRPGDNAIDIGANIGYVTSIIAARVGPQGRVLAFEPHPGLCEELRKNVSAWGPSNAQVDVLEAALSDRSGRGSLCVPPGFQENRGVSHVLTPCQNRANLAAFPIELRRLDDMWKDRNPIALAVLKGARRLLESRLIQNIVFENFGGPDSQSVGLLREFGYTIWQLSCELFGPRLSAPGARKQPPWLPPNFLASLTPAVAEESLRPRGWRILRP